MFDWFRSTSRQREPTPSLYESMAQLRSDMAELQRETLALQESTLKTLRKLAKRAERDCGCKEGVTVEMRADPGGRMSIHEARAKYGRNGGV